MIAALQPSITIGDTSWYEGFYHNASALSANQYEA
jgi:hypothetical protein